MISPATAKALADEAKKTGVAPPTMTTASMDPGPAVEDPHAKSEAPEGTMTSSSVTFEQRPIPKGDPWEGVEAKPLSAPAIDQIKSKNPNLSFRWVNRSCGTQTPNLRFEQAQAQGFVPATVNDCVPPPGSLQDGIIRFYDVILMKIDKRKLLGAMKWNNDRVNQAVRRGGVLADGRQKLKEDLAKVGADTALHNAERKSGRSMVQVYVPGQSELE
jgi:hypothetical protein